MDEKKRARDIAPTRDAATVLLIRDGRDGIEVFVAVRPDKIDFASGALVFPGGGVDPQDRNPVLRQHVRGQEAWDDSTLAFRVAAVREAFEECGVLLARRRENGQLLNRDEVTVIAEKHAEALAGHNLDMIELVRGEALELACDLLVEFAHWITPVSRPKRFDTRFYLAPAPSDQSASHDGYESIHSFWATPDAVCAEADEGKWHVMFPTRMNLQKLGQSETIADALESARQSPVVPILPDGQPTEGGRILSIPAEAGYGVTEVFVDKRGAFRRIES